MFDKKNSNTKTRETRVELVEEIISNSLATKIAQKRNSSQSNGDTFELFTKRKCTIN